MNENNQSDMMLERLIDRFDKKIDEGGITMDVREKLVDLIIDAKRTDPERRWKKTEASLKGGKDHA